METWQNRRKGPHQATGTYYESREVVERFRLRKLYFRCHWTLMANGQPESLGAEIDGLLGDGGIPRGRVEEHLFAAASQNGVSTSATEALLRWRLLGIWTARLEGLSERNRASVLGSIRRGRGRVDALERRVANAWRALRWRVVARLRAATPNVEFRGELGDDDLRLVSRWPRSPGKTTDGEMKRLGSARLGEKAAISYYGGLGRQVEDVSIQDLETEERQDWVTHDLRVDGRPLDVKNSRCVRDDRFTEHYWKSPKYWKSPTQTEGEEMPIVGVVAVEESDVSMVLGELRRSELEHFAREVAGHAEGPRIGIEVRRDDWFVPGWLLEYPDRHYERMPDWNDVLRRWLQVSEALDAQEPPWILALASSRTGSPPERLGTAKVTEAMLAFSRGSRCLDARCSGSYSTTCCRILMIQARKMTLSRICSRTGGEIRRGSKGRRRASTR